MAAVQEATVWAKNVGLTSSFRSKFGLQSLPDTLTTPRQHRGDTLCFSSVVVLTFEHMVALFVHWVDFFFYFSIRETPEREVGEISILCKMLL